jgi:hypothetical protein
MAQSTIGDLFMLCGVLCIFVSLFFWIRGKGKELETGARSERNALFVGLWAPSFFALATYFRVAARLQ